MESREISGVSYAWIERERKPRYTQNSLRPLDDTASRTPLFRSGKPASRRSETYENKMDTKLRSSDRCTHPWACNGTTNGAVPFLSLQWYESFASSASSLSLDWPPNLPHPPYFHRRRHSHPSLSSSSFLVLFVVILFLFMISSRLLAVGFHDHREARLAACRSL